MAAGISVVISAQDQITATIDKINAKMAAFSGGIQKQMAPYTASVENAQRSLKKFADQSGLTRVAKGFGDVARGAQDAFYKIGQVVGPLSVITSAASLAGMVRMVSAWADWGTKLGFAAQRIGIGADQLNALQGAGRLAGASADAVTSGLQALGQTMYDAIGGRAPQAIALFQALGVEWRQDALHAKSVTEVLPQLADKIAGASSDPYTQAQIATTLFGGAAEQLLPFLRRGSAGIAEYTAMAQKYAPVTKAGAEAAFQLEQAQTALSLSVDGLSHRISEKLAPILGPLLTQLADWLATSPAVTSAIDALGTAVSNAGDYIKSIDWHAVGQGIQSWIDPIEAVVHAIGGWNAAIAAVVLAMGPNFIGAITAVGGALTFLATTPVGLVITALAGLGIAGYELYNHWNEISGEFQSLWNGIKDIFEKNTGYARTAAELLFPIPMAIIGHWSQLGDFFARLWGGIRSVFQDGWDFIKPIIDDLKGAADWVANSWVGQKLGVAGGAVGSAASWVGGELGAGAAVVGGAIGGAARRGAASLDRTMGFTPSFDTNLTPQARGLLDTIAGTESPGYNVEYGGKRFNDFSHHPNDANAITSGPNAGQTSTAAGRYQFLKSTWDDAQKALGLKDFSPASQDKAAWWLAQRDYSAKTGRDLEADLQSKDPAVRAGIGTALHSTWTSLPGGIEAGTNTNRFTAQLDANTQRESVPVPSAPPVQIGDGSGVTNADLQRGMDARLRVDINHSNVPPGTTASVSSDDSRVQMGSLRIARAMPGDGTQ